MSNFKWFMKYLIHLYHVILRHTHEYELRDGTKMIDLGINRKQLIHDNILVGIHKKPNGFAQLF